MDGFDRKLLNILQHDFPISVEPFREIGQQMNLSEQEVLQRVENLQEQGIIRRLGAVLDAKQLGFYSSLCACRLPKNKISEWADVIWNIPAITHNYIRDHEYNVWFTITAASPSEAKSLIHDLETRFDLKIWSMPAQKVYKIKVSFEMGTVNDV